MKISRKSNKYYKRFGIGIILICIGLILDIYVKITNKALIFVVEDFVANIYSAIFTIAAISGMALSIVISSFGENYYGFTVKEILKFEDVKYDLADLISMSLSIALISTFLLLFKCINTMLITLIYLIYIIINHISYAWKISIDDIFCYKIVEEEINRTIRDNDIDDIKLKRKKLFSYYVDTLGKIEFEYNNRTLELIELLITEAELADSGSRILINRQIASAFDEAIHIIGYTNAIQDVLKLYNVNSDACFSGDKIGVLIKPIKELQFYSEEIFESSSMTRIYRDIEELNCLTDREKSAVLHSYFSNVYSNDLISLEYKNMLINKYFINLLMFDGVKSMEYDVIRRDITLYILKNHVLLNPDKKLREMIFINIIDGLSYNKYSEDIEYFNTLAMSLLAMYFYSFKEVHTLDVSHREELKDLALLRPISIRLEENRFIDLMFLNIGEIIKCIFHIGLDKKEKYLSYEYYPYNFHVKTVVWTQESIIDFGLKLCLIYYSNIPGGHRELIDDLEKLDIKLRRKVLLMFKGFFDETGKLTDKTISSLEEISVWLEEKLIVFDSHFEAIYWILNDKIKEINDKDIEKALLTIDDRPDMTEYNNKLVKYIERRKYFGYYKELSLEEGEVLYFKPIVLDINTSIDNMVYNISQGIAELLNSLIKEKMPTEILSFDIDGVNKLSGLLETKDVDSRNYNYIGDLVFKKDVLESDSYKHLSEQIISLEHEKTYPIRPYMFFKSKGIRFNLRILDLGCTSLTREESEKFTEDFKVAEGLYEINDGIYDKSKAIDTVQKIYRNYHISIKFKSTISEDSGFIVDFAHRIRN